MIGEVIPCCFCDVLYPRTRLCKRTCAHACTRARVRLGKHACVWFSACGFL